MSGVATKVCARCKVDKPVGDFYSRGIGRGPISYCKPCHGEHAMETYHRRRAGIAPKRQNLTAGLSTGQKRCASCGAVFPLAAFPMAGGKHRSNCLTCHNAKNASYKADRPESIKQSHARYREANREALAERQKRWREENPESYRAIHAKWKANNKAAVNASTHKRRNQIVANGGHHWTAAEWSALKVQYDHRCLACLRQEPEIQLTVDHIVPVSEGGSNAIDNIQPLCKSCNSKKHRGTLDLRARV